MFLGMEKGGGTVIVQGLPSDWLFGFDLMRWAIGEKFSGVAEIPPGVHYIYTSAAANELGVNGEFLNVSDGEIFLFRFDNLEERLVRDEISNIDSLRTDHRIGSGLAPFHRVVERHSQWVKLTGFITGEILQMMEKGKQFPLIPNLVIPRGATAAEISAYAMDKSTHLNQLIESREYSNVTEILGEIQAAYIVFLLAQNYDALIHWRILIELFLGCHTEGIKARQSLFCHFIDVLSAQLEDFPSEILSGEDDSGRMFLVSLIAQFLDECEEIEEMKTACDNLNIVMVGKFEGNENWAELVLNEDDQPVVVDNSS